MKKIKLFLILFYGICYSQLKVEPTDLEKLAIGGRLEYFKMNIIERKPLFIFNGIELLKKNSVINKIDPTDIENVNILKDEAAIEKYGHKATNGVVKVTIKKNKLKKYKKLLKSKTTTEEATETNIFDKNQYNTTISGLIKGKINQIIPRIMITNLTKKEVYYTDSLGNYKIDVAQNDFINFSKKGFESQRIIAKKDSVLNITLKVQTTPSEVMVKKPVIYLYPTSKTNISINIDFKGKLLTSFPKYDTNWTVTAYPDGRIFDKKTNRFYSSLFWDGTQNFPDAHYNYQSGFVVSKNDLTNFLIEKLEYIGLNNAETNEFVQFWLPILEKNETNFIYFYVNEAYDVISKNTISPKPDTEIRLFMEFYGLEQPLKIWEQKLQKTERKGFTVVEWGGSDASETIKELKKLKL